MSPNSQTLVIPPHSGIGWSCAGSGCPQPEAWLIPRGLPGGCTPCGTSISKGDHLAHAWPPPRPARPPRSGPHLSLHCFGHATLLTTPGAENAVPPQASALAAPSACHALPLTVIQVSTQNVTSSKSTKWPILSRHATSHHLSDVFMRSSLPQIILFVSLPRRRGGGEGRAGTAV